MVFSPTKRYTREMRLFVPFSFDFCGFYPWFSWLLKSKVIAFFVKFYFKKNNQRNALLVLLNLKRKSEENYIKFKEWILGSINRLFKILRLDKKKKNKKKKQRERERETGTECVKWVVSKKILEMLGITSNFGSSYCIFISSSYSMPFWNTPKYNHL